MKYFLVTAALALAASQLASGETADGGLWAFNFVPAGLEPAYAGDREGAMVFLRVTVD